MKAVRIHAPCSPEGVVYEDAPRPEVKADEVLIRVHAAGVNPADWQVMSRELPGGQYPWVPGYDVSGVVELAGSMVSAPQKGDAVYGMLFPAPAGAFAEYAVAKVGQVCGKPTSVGHIAAAALPIAALTAWQALFDRAQLCAGQRVLIHAAAGGVGHLAVQLAKLRGAYVFGTGSAANTDFLHIIGVDEAIDYTAVRFENVARNIDIVLDPFGGEIATRSLPVLRKGGILVSLKDVDISVAAAARGKRAEYLLASADRTQLQEITRLVDSGKLGPNIQDVFPLSEARRALEISKQGHTRGKIVLRAPGI
jgi:NADPH2:quinone reductase